ncbi:hypothetical protein [Fictibacillus nanhaiensis]|nr:hypothetical protein [Fictibacillus nanhaiensis]
MKTKAMTYFHWKSHREIYLTPAMKCHEPHTWRPVVSVGLE